MKKCRDIQWFLRKKQTILIYKIISWVAVALWMAFIFQLSAQVREESNQLSTGITEVVVKVAEKVVPEKEFDINSINHIIRKNAHFFAFFALGILVINALRASKTVDVKRIIIALCICVLYAVSDEVHQLFVPGRGGQFKDVLIDSSGSITGIFLYAFCCRMIRAKGKTG